MFAGAAACQTGAISDADLRLLRVFSVVVAAGGLSAATAELQADLSSVSRHVKELESRVGARLCIRGRGGFALTPAGTKLYLAAQELFAALGAFRTGVQGLQTQVGADLRLGVVDALLTDPSMRLAQALAHCIDHTPGLRLSVAMLRPIEIERQLLAGELDAGILAAHLPAAGLARCRLYAESSSLYCAHGHPWFDQPSADPFDPAEAASLNIVADPYTVDLPKRVFAGELPTLARADSIEGVAMLIKTGRCAGFMPDHYVEAVDPLSVFKRIRPDVFSYTQDIELTYRRGAPNPLVLMLLDRLAGEQPSQVAGGRGAQPQNRAAGATAAMPATTGTRSPRRA